MNILHRLRAMPPGSLVPAEWIASQIEAEGPEQGGEPAAAPPVDAAPTWREKLWTAPAETRIGIAELREAFDRPASWVYRHTSAKTIPHRKLDGELIFTVGELRAWAREREEIVHAGPMESTPAERSHLKAS